MRIGLEKILKYCVYWNNYFICEKSLKSNGCYGWERDEGKKYFCINWWWMLVIDGVEEFKCCFCIRFFWLFWLVVLILVNIFIFLKYWCLLIRYVFYLVFWGCVDCGYFVLIEV